MKNFILKYERIFGLTATIFSTFMFLALIEVASNNLHNNKKIIIQPLLTVINCILWSLYGTSKKDWFIISPNLVGILMGIFTIFTAFI